MKKNLTFTFVPRNGITLFLLFISSLSFAQIYKTGYIIKLNDDTIHGKIYDGGELMNTRGCKFKSEHAKSPVKYRVNQIKAYKIGDNKLFEAHSNAKGELVFMEVLLQGKIDLLYYAKGNTTRFFLKKDDRDPVPLINDYVQLHPEAEYITGQVTSPTSYFAEMELYKDSLYYLLDSCKAILHELNVLEYDQKSLVNISKNYLNETCGKTECISYQKDFSIVRDRFGFYSGILLSDYTVTIPDPLADSDDPDPEMINVIAPVFSVPIGVFYSIPLKKLSDRLYFQPELIYTRSDYYDMITTPFGPREIEITKQSIKLPILLKYEASINKFKPSIAAGWEISYMLDLKIPVSNDLNIQNRLEPGRWVVQAELAYPLGSKLDIFARAKVFSPTKKIDKTERRSTSSTYNDGGKIKASFHVGILF